MTVAGPGSAGRPGDQGDRSDRDDRGDRDDQGERDDRSDRDDGSDLDDGGDQRDLPASGLTLEVVAGHPSADELAALTVALAAALAAGDPQPGPGRAGRHGGASSVWADRAAMVSAPLMPGPDAWRRGARPGRAGRLA